jgi:hypothetical protein
LKEYLGVLVEKQPDGRTKLSQPQLIKQILGDLWYNDRTKPKATPAPGGQVLERELDAEPMNDDFHYRSVIGKANFVEKSTRPDIAVAVHQCTRFSTDPKQSHADAVRYFGKYLQGTKSEGIYLDPNDDKSFECWVYADFLGQYIKGAKDMELDAIVGQNEREGLKDRNQGHKVRFRLNPGERATDGKKSQTTTTTEKKTPTIGRSYADIVRRATRKVGVVSKIVQPILLTL